MGRTLAQIFKDADAIIEKTASVPAQEDFVITSDADEDIFKLAEAVRSSGRNKEASFKGFTRLEKVAYAKAIVEALSDSERLNKIASFSKQASEKGLQEQADAFVKKATAVSQVDLIAKR